MEQKSYNTLNGGGSVYQLIKGKYAGFRVKITKLEQTLIVVCWVLVIVANVTSHKLTAEKVCDTEVCKLAADKLKDTMNESINPCEDFYSYVCSGWKRDNPIPETRAHYVNLLLVEDKIINELIEALQNAGKYEEEDVRTKVKRFYTSCIDIETRQAKGVEGLKAVLKSLGGWPLLGETIETGYDWTDALAYATSELAYNPIISFSVGPDDKNTSQNIIKVDEAKFGLKRDNLINTNRSNQKVRRIMKAYAKLIKQSAKLLGSVKTENELDNDINDMIEFERTLAKFTRSKEEKRDLYSCYKKMTVDRLQLELNTEQIDILSLLNKVMKNITELTNNTKIIVKELDYLKQTCKLLEQNNTKTETIANYIGWIIVRGYGEHTTKEFADAFFEFDKVTSGTAKAKPLNETCIKKANEYFRYALGNIFINNGFNDQTKTEIERMTVQLKTAFEELLQTNKWMDKETKKESLNKLNEMIPMVAYPTWLNDTKKLNGYYDKLGEIIEGSHLENVINIVKFIIRTRLNKINKPFNRTEKWGSGPAVANAFYSPNSNLIRLPAGILQPPFYQVGLPAALNFGGIGSIIGHEITHGFDNTGSQYDAQGNLKEWWTPEARSRFKNESKCFVEQYGSYKEPITGMNLNGNNTLGENIADNGGLRQAFKAYKSATSGIYSNMRLPGLDMTSDQLFFVGFAYAWCADARKEHLELALKYDAHSPPPFRIRGVLSNFEEFAKAFKCPRNSTMNPDHKCLLW